MSENNILDLKKKLDSFFQIVLESISPELMKALNIKSIEEIFYLMKIRDLLEKSNILKNEQFKTISSDASIARRNLVVVSDEELKESIKNVLRQLRHQYSDTFETRYGNIPNNIYSINKIFTEMHDLLTKSLSK